MDSGAIYRLHRPMNVLDGKLGEACPKCLGGTPEPDGSTMAEPRPCGCWGRINPVCGVCAVRSVGSGHWYWQDWPCATAVAFGVHWWT